MLRNFVFVSDSEDEAQKKVPNTIGNESASDEEILQSDLSGEDYALDQKHTKDFD